MEQTWSPESRLSLVAATALVQAAIAWHAKAAGVDVVFVKGIGAQHHGLRRGHISTDVDALCRAADAEVLLDQLARWGWQPRSKPSTASRHSNHATTLVHPQWPCDVDVHIRFPGLLADPDLVFEVLLSDADTIDVAGIECLVPCLADSLVILAAHSVRTQARIESSATALRKLRAWVDENLDLDGQRQVAQRASMLGASQAARTVLGPEVASEFAHAASVPTAASKAWARTAAAGHSILSTAANAVAQDGVWRSRRFLATVVWPSRRDIELSVGARLGLSGRVRYRAARLLRGLKLLTSSLRRRLGGAQANGVKGSQGDSP